MTEVNLDLLLSLFFVACLAVGAVSFKLGWLKGHDSGWNARHKRAKSDEAHAEVRHNDRVVHLQARINFANRLYNELRAKGVVIPPKPQPCWRLFDVVIPTNHAMELQKANPSLITTGALVYGSDEPSAA